MGALRWILLAAGVLFLLALAAWEKRKPRQAARDSEMRALRRTERALGNLPEQPAEIHAPAELRGGVRADAASRRPVVSPPHVDLPAIEAMRDRSIIAESDALQMIDEPVPVVTGTEQPALAEPYVAAEPYAIAEPDADAKPDTGYEAEPASPPGEATPPAFAARAESAITVDAATAAIAAAPTPPVVDWPPDGERHILALRIVAGSGDRLSGRAVRLAITACGFVHGRFGIYHQPDAQGRALLSIASLSKPGILDPINLDFQRLSGISLFAVLPGPLPPAAALDRLIDTARDLSQRLSARLQDERGQPLDARRLEELRESVQCLALQHPSRPGLHAEPAA